MLNEVMLTEACLEPGRTSTMELFSLQLSNILKTYSIAFKLHFLHNSSFRQKTCNPENFGRKSLLLTLEHFFFRNSKLRIGMAPSINRSSHRRCSIKKDVLRNFSPEGTFLTEHLWATAPE